MSLRIFEEVENYDNAFSWLFEGEETVAKESEDAQATLTTTDRDGFIRTAIVAGPGNKGSIDVVDADGNVLLTLNLFKFETYFDVDVIAPVPTPTTVIAWSQGGQTIRETHNGSVTAVCVGMEK